MLIFSLLMAIANASPAGPALGGISLGSPLPSGFVRGETNGITVTNTWVKLGTVAGIEGKFQVETCNGVVQDITFYPIMFTGVEHQIWSYALEKTGFTSPLSYNWCTEEEGYMCKTFWKNPSKNRTILMMWMDDHMPALNEWYDKPCTEGI